MRDRVYILCGSRLKCVLEIKGCGCVSPQLGRAGENMMLKVVVSLEKSSSLRVSLPGDWIPSHWDRGGEGDSINRSAGGGTIDKKPK